MPVPYDLKKIGRILDELRNKRSSAEAMWCVDRQWAPLPPSPDGSTPKGTWCKAIVDVHNRDGAILHLKDYKSGREYPASHREQLELYSVVGLLHHPDAKRAESTAVYIDGGYESCDGSIIREMLPKLIEKWTHRAIAIEQDTTFEPKPMKQKCSWCAFASGKGGPCDASRVVGE
jgi:hypothetical protein